MTQFRFSATHTLGKPGAINEDAFSCDEKRIVVADGATGKLAHPLRFGALSAGAYLADIACRYAMSSYGLTLGGHALIDALTQKIAHEYREFGHQSTLETHPEAWPSASLAAVTIDTAKGELSIVQVGDVLVRVNGDQVFENPRPIDRFHAACRGQAYRLIEERFPDWPHSEQLTAARKAIEPLLQAQVRLYQNTESPPWGHGVLDGRPVPVEFVRCHAVPLAEVELVEVATDGYPEPPLGAALADWEQIFRRAIALDPLRLGDYAGTKPFPDDRTVVIAEVA